MDKEKETPEGGNGEPEQPSNTQSNSNAEGQQPDESLDDLRSKLTNAESELAKERTSRKKTDSEFMRQSNEVGALKKKIKELEQPPKPAATQEPPAPDITVLDTLSVEEIQMFDGVLNDPKNADLKKKVLLGGKPAMAEFVSAYRTQTPIDFKASVFAQLRNKETNSVPKNSIAKMVKELFKEHDTTEKEGLAAIPPTGAPADRNAKATKQMVIGGVDVEFFKKQ